ncbi:MAG: UrcA family protein [Hyphomonadaceae bacterium]|nr:UrcA family protein [Hyphomonadaceae bacterium]
MNAKHAVIMACVAGLGLPLAQPVHAQAWKVGPSYVIRFSHLDLSQPADRAALLIQVERSASKLCAGVRTKARRETCTAAAVTESLGASPSEVRQAVQTARLERDGQQQAQR